MSDIFREVDEDLRHEQYKRLWDRFGPYVIGLAVLIVAVGLLGVLTVGEPDRLPPLSVEDALTIRLEENKGQMSDLRFIEVVTELLQADRHYHQRMAEILNRIQDRDISAEMPVLHASARNENEYLDRGEGALAAAASPSIAN